MGMQVRESERSVEMRGWGCRGRKASRRLQTYPSALALHSRAATSTLSLIATPLHKCPHHGAFRGPFVGSIASPYRIQSGGSAAC